MLSVGVPPEVLFLFGDWNISAHDMDTYRYRMGVIILKKDMPAILGSQFLQEFLEQESGIPIPEDLNRIPEFRP
jgi:hypothetical protein